MHSCCVDDKFQGANAAYDVVTKVSPGSNSSCRLLIAVIRSQSICALHLIDAGLLLGVASFTHTTLMYFIHLLNLFMVFV